MVNFDLLLDKKHKERENKMAKKQTAEEWEWKPGDDEEEVGGDLNIWNPAVDGKEGDELIGEVVALEEGIYGIQAQIKAPDDEIITTPAHKVLQSALAKLSVGDVVRITFTGAYKVKASGLYAKTYKVARRK